MGIIDFKATKCRHCYKCVRNCPVKAIQIKDQRALVVEEACILCGRCLKTCPQSAKSWTSDREQVRRWISDGERVAVSLAPSYMGYFQYQAAGQVKGALLRLGFSDVRETSEGAAAVTGEYLRLLGEGRMENIITTCCPSANDLVEMYFSKLVPYLAPVVSPMVAHGKMLKQELGREVKVVFLGPCIAKKKESVDKRHDGFVDAVMSFDEAEDWLLDEEIEVSQCDPVPFYREDPGINRLYPVTGGVIRSVDATGTGEDGYRRLYVHGAENCLDLCRSLELGEVRGCFIEMNMCQGGCIQGPAVARERVSRFKVKLDMEAAVEVAPAGEGLLKAGLGSLELGKVFADHSPREAEPTEEQIQEILSMTGKNRPEDELNCGACGYPTCREKAVAVFQKKAELNMCIPFMHEKAESLANLVMETSPNIVLIVDRDMRIKEYSSVGERYFGKTRQEALQMYLYELIDPVDFQWVFDTKQNIHGKKVDYPEYRLATLQNVVYIAKEDVVLATFVDITKEEEQAKQDYEKKLETIDLAQKVIYKQMMVAQEIAGLLGETTAETKTTLTKLCRSLLEDGSEGGGA